MFDFHSISLTMMIMNKLGNIQAKLTINLEIECNSVKIIYANESCDCYEPDVSMDY